MKVIDLLNKMANNEDFRPTIKFFSTTYKYDKTVGDYENNKSSEWGVFSDYTINNILNDEVELIEDKINIQEIEEVKIGTVCDTRDLIINKLIQAVKQIDKKLKEKEQC